MSYLRVRKFWEYQNADAWKKAKANKGGHRHPAWHKSFVARDQELDCEDPMTRLVFKELLGLATIHDNAILNDISKIANAISLPTQATSKAIERLLEVGWLLETRTARRSREPSRNSRDQIEIERREEKPLRKRSRDEVWDSLVEQLGEPQTKSERGRFNAAVKELKEIEASPQEIAQRCSVYRRRWPSMTLTPQALTSNWTNLEQPKLVAVAPVEEVVDLPLAMSEDERQANLARLAEMLGGGVGRSL